MCERRDLWGKRGVRAARLEWRRSPVGFNSLIKHISYLIFRSWGKISDTDVDFNGQGESHDICIYTRIERGVGWGERKRGVRASY